MKRIGNKILFSLMLAIIVCASAVAEDIKVFAAIDDAESIYLGDTFALHIVLDGVSAPAQNIDISPLAQWNPSGPSTQNASQSSITIINGRQTVSETKRFIMSYQLTAFAQGQFTIPSISVKVDNKTYQTIPLNITVLTAGTTDKMEIRVELSDKACYLGQPVTIDINWYIFSEIKNYSLNFPLFQRDDFYFENNPSFDDAVAQKGSITISGIQVPAYQKQSLLGGRQCALIKMQKVIIPKTAGEIDLGSATANADIAVGTKQASRSNDPFDGFFERSNKQYKRFVVKSEPAILNVKPLPTENKPVGFYGLVGKYFIRTVAVTAEKTDDGKPKVAVGEPITLAISIGPSDYLEPVKAPDLSAIPEFAQNFRIPSQQSAPEIKDNYKIFTQTIRAENDTITQIPSVELPYFDAEKGTYEIAKSQPIEIMVTPAAKLTASDFLGSGTDSTSRELARIQQGISANYETPDALADQHFSITQTITSPAYIIAWSLPMATIMLSLVYKLATYTTPQKQLARKRRSALTKAKSAIKAVNINDYVSLAQAMQQYIGDRFNKSAHSLTAYDCYNIILQNTGDESLARSYRDILEQCQTSQYAPVQLTLDQTQIKTTINLMYEIDRKSK